MFTFLLREAPAAWRDLRRHPPLANHVRAAYARQLESASMAAMMLGIVALCQPWSEVLHRYSVLAIIIGPGGLQCLLAHQDAASDVESLGTRPCRARQGPSDMADIQIIDAEKHFGANHVIRKLNLQHPARRVRRAARALGLRQDDHAARAGRAGEHRLGRDPHRRAARRPSAAAAARHGLRVPALFAVPAPHRLRQHRLPAARRGHARGEGATSRSTRSGQGAAHRAPARRSGRRRWPAATCSA